MIRARIDHLRAVAKERGPGYLEACLKAGRISRDGHWIIFTDEAHAQLRARHNPNPPKPRQARRMPSLYARAKNLGKAILSAGKDLVRGKLKQRAPAEIDACLTICHDCEFFKNNTMRCTVCGCKAALKSRLHSWHCPLPNPKW